MDRPSAFESYKPSKQMKLSPKTGIFRPIEQPMQMPAPYPMRPPPPQAPLNPQAPPNPPTANLPGLQRYKHLPPSTVPPPPPPPSSLPCRSPRNEELLSAYHVFFQSMREKLLKENEEIRFSDISKVITSQWNKLDDKERYVYEKMAIKRKEKQEQERKAKQVLPKLHENACFTVTVGEIREKANKISDHNNADNHAMSLFQSYLKSSGFRDFINGCGLDFESFSESTELNGMLYQRFTNILKSSRDVLESQSQKVAIVFHGTHPQNIDNILKSGLDSARRWRQSYGQGEYFSKDPTVSVRYCRGGQSMLVFAIILPPPHKLRRDLPRSYVVVEENTHQLPLGVLKFGCTNPDLVARSTYVNSQLVNAQRRFQEQMNSTKESQNKALIIQLLIQSKCDLAAEKYDRFRFDLSLDSKREIAMQVHRAVDQAVIEILFPDLPPPFAWEEFQNKGNTFTVEWQEKELKKAKTKLDCIKSASKK